MRGREMQGISFEAHIYELAALHAPVVRALMTEFPSIQGIEFATEISPFAIRPVLEEIAHEERVGLDPAFWSRATELLSQIADRVWELSNSFSDFKDRGSTMRVIARRSEIEFNVPLHFDTVIRHSSGDVRVETRYLEVDGRFVVDASARLVIEVEGQTVLNQTVIKAAVSDRVIDQLLYFASNHLLPGLADVDLPELIAWCENFTRSYWPTEVAFAKNKCQTITQSCLSPPFGLGSVHDNEGYGDDHAIVSKSVTEPKWI